MLNMPLEEIKRKIQEQTDLSLEQVNARVSEKMKQLAGLISEEGACHIIANEMHVKLLPDPSDRTVKDLLPGMRDVKQDLRVVQVYELRTFQSKYSEGEGKVASFLGGDESGVIRVTCWGDHAETCAKLNAGADVVRVKNAYVKDNNGRAELHLNNNSELIVNPEGVTVKAGERQQQGSDEYVSKKINELSKGDFRVELLGTVVQVYDPRFFERKNDGTAGAVVNVMIDDGTGNVRVGCFDDTAAAALGLSKDDLLKRGEAPYDKEKTELLGRIVKVSGRAKLNTVYNSIEVTADKLEIDPSPSGGAQAPPKKEEPKATPATTKAEQLEAAKDVKPAKPKKADEAVSLDELDDLDLDDLDDLDDEI